MEEVWSRIQQQDEQITAHLNSIWNLATTGSMGNKTREGIKDHLRRIAILRKAQKAALAELNAEAAPPGAD